MFRCLRCDEINENETCNGLCESCSEELGFSFREDDCEDYRYELDLLCKKEAGYTF